MLVSDVKYVKDYVIDVTFRTGEVKRYDFKKWLFSDINPMLYKFRKLSNFKKVRVENGIIVWGDDEMDFTPDHMVEMEVRKKIRATSISANPVFAFLKDKREDIYSIHDGKPIK